jgi:ArsR family transcriptional regulator
MTPTPSLEVASLAQLYKALGDPTRLRIAALLSHGELCVCHVEEALALSQPTASRHLAVLKGAGVVAARREGSWMYYCLAKQADARRERALREAVRDFSDSAGLRRQVAKLVKSCGPGACQ